MDELQGIDMVGLHQRHPGLTQALGETFVEAAAVCFSKHYVSPVELNVRKPQTAEKRNLSFLSPDERTKKAHGNDTDATEIGAYGVSLATIETVEGLVAVRRAEKLTGADWYLASKGSNDGEDDLEGCVRLEVSGIDVGNSADVDKRLRRKVLQAAKGQSNLPAIASVVCFKGREVAISAMSQAK